MTHLVPIPLGLLLRRAIAEHARRGAVFDLPEAKWYRGGEVSTAVPFHGRSASTPLGPAAGPHTQLAQNIVLSWLGGARIIELKTVRPKNEIVSAADRLIEYAKAWFLLHALRDAGITKDHWAARPDTRFDVSLGGDLAALESAEIAAFVRGVRDASEMTSALREELSGDLARFRDVEVPSAMCNSVTLNPADGCSAEDIEAIAAHLGELGMGVIVKLSPTLLGYEAMREQLGRLGYDDVAPRREPFEHGLGWAETLAMFERLGPNIGAKLSSALEIDNRHGERRMFLSGPPIHPISLGLALRFREALGASFPVSFSGGIDAQNFADAVAAGFSPITTCSDLLRPGGYGRLQPYMAALEARMRDAGARDIPSFILAAEHAAAAGIHDVAEASLHNLRRIAARVAADERYTKRRTAGIPRKIGASLMLLDCISCDECIPVCPNDANFSYRVAAVSSFSEEAFVADDGALRRRTGVPFVVERDHQIGNYADLCDDCGNCDPFCPEDGGPYLEKPRFFGSLERFRRDDKPGAFYVAASRDLVDARARIDGREYQLRLERTSGAATFSDGTLELSLDASGVIDGIRPVAAAPPVGHVLSTLPARTMLTIILGVLDPQRPNPVNAALLSL